MDVVVGDVDSVSVLGPGLGAGGEGESGGEDGGGELHFG